MTTHVLPDHDGGAIYHLSASLLQHYGLDAPSPPLRPDVLPEVALGDTKRIVHLLLDAFGFLQMHEALADGLMPNLQALLADSHLARMTSVFPSTTTAAVTSIFHALPPARHGVLGFQMYFDELAMMANLIGYKAMDGSGRDLPLEEVRREKNIHQRLVAGGVRSFAVLPRAYDNTPFTRLLYEGSVFLGYEGAAEIPYLVTHACQLAGSSPVFVSAYWAMIDLLAHRHGPMSAPYRTELRMVDVLLGELAATCKRLGATLVILADHGQVNLPVDKAVTLPAEISRMLQGLPAGERRVPYFRAHEPEALQARLEALVPEIAFLRPDSEEAAALFGGPLGEFTGRAGNLVARFLNGGQFINPQGYNRVPEPGGHGSTTAAEMLVPLIVSPV